MRDDKPGEKPKGARAERLAQQLRANLQRRKSQTRARRQGDADGRPEGLAGAAKPTK